MAKTKVKYVCQACGYESLTWLGKCTNCGGWNTFAEETVAAATKTFVQETTNNKLVPLDAVETNTDMRIPTGIEEFDRVLGGGFCTGSITLLGGEPGIGKSTISLQIAKTLADKNLKTLYISGEESPQQIRLRAERLQTVSENIALLCATNIHEIEKAIKAYQPVLTIIDSIQTIYHPDIPSAPGSVGQVRESSAWLIRFLKDNNSAAVFVGHVTKEGALAGPKVLEHMVDTVLYFEGERSQNFRIVRGIKNRFGSTNEIGIFDMRSEGLVEVPNASELFIQNNLDIPGTMITACLEGSRSFLVEIQALTAASSLSMPRRTITGLDFNRAAIILAVLEKKCGLRLSTQDVFLNVVGGVRVNDTGADLAIALAIASSFRDTIFGKKICAFGEVGLGGELRSVSNLEKRLNEAEKLGFTTAVIPQSNLKNLQKKYTLELIAPRTLAEALAKIS
ncbi:DNA repair protein RadA [Candidatus Termititenax dinenymphae]|uniref:DNA repair protein RadA n=1 Tax=Candidatus Termititenax dinenymphae TaxID=2218523 RepID=A0A388TKN8_9BACT|nr:DNA repair protein RadA [Candidatus Termititenax dinenymphae]